MADPASPILQDPINGQKIYGNVIVLSFTIPAEADSDALAFKVELDVNDPPLVSSPEYRSYESGSSDTDPTQGRWQQKSNFDQCWYDFTTTKLIFENIQLNEAVNTMNNMFYVFNLENLEERGNGRVILNKKDITDFPSTAKNYYWRVLVSDTEIFPMFNLLENGTL